jgi:hypothetical protein
MFSKINFIRMPQEGWMKNNSSLPKMNEIVSLTLTFFPTPLSALSPLSWWPLIFHISSATSLP